MKRNSFLGILLSARRLRQPDLLFRETIQLIDQPVDLPVRGLDAAGEQGSVVIGGIPCLKEEATNPNPA